MSQEQQKKSTPADKVTAEAFVPTRPKPGFDIDVDDLLDEMDSVLEENAEEFVAQYIQKGGQ